MRRIYEEYKMWGSKLKLSNKRPTPNKRAIIKTIFSNPDQYEITKLSGGYLGRAQKVSLIGGEENYILKTMGNTDDQIAHSLFLLQHIKGFGEVLSNMAKVCDWQNQDDGSLLALFEFIENTEDRLPNIAEMIQISNLDFMS